MRRFPHSWSKTLSSLGFKRKVNRVRRDPMWRRNSVWLEQLESREMLAVDLAYIATDDTSSYSSSPGTNYGTSSVFRTATNRTGFLRFDLSDIDAGTITNADLKLVSNQTDDDESSTSTLYAVANDTWSESTLNWSNKPSLGASLAAWNISRYQTKYIDVTSHVNDAIQNDDKLISFGVKSSYHAWVNYASSEANNASWRPTLYVTVEVSLDPPVASADSYDVVNGGFVHSETATTGVLANDTNPNASETMTAELVAGPQHGTLSLNADGSFSYTANASYVGSDSFTYQARSGTELSAVETVTLNVGPRRDVSYGPTADTWVNGAIGSQGVNYGASGVFRVDSSNDTHGYLRFDLTELTGQVYDAKLTLYADYIQSFDGTIDHTLHAVADDSWEETTLTWTDKPVLGASLGSWFQEENQYTTIDITSHVNSALLSGDKYISLAIDSNDTEYVEYASRENANAAWRPKLELSGRFENAPAQGVLTQVLASASEDADVAAPIHVADVTITDDPFGTNTLVLEGADAGYFELVGQSLYLKAGVALDFETKPTLNASVRIDDAEIDDALEVSLPFTLSVTDANEAPNVSLTNVSTSLSEHTDTSAGVKVADIVVADDALGTNVVDVNGADNERFEVIGSELWLVAGTELDYEFDPELSVTVTVDDAAVGASPDGAAPLTIVVTDANDAPSISLSSVVARLPDNTDTTTRTQVAELEVLDDALGVNNLSLSGLHAGLFELEGVQLFLSAGVTLDSQTQSSLQVSVRVDDATIGAGYEQELSIEIDVHAVDENLPPTLALVATRTVLKDTINTSFRRKVANVLLADDGRGANSLSLSGPHAAMFEIDESELFLKAGALLDAAMQSTLSVSIDADDASLGAGADASATLELVVTPGAPSGLAEDPFEVNDTLAEASVLGGVTSLGINDLTIYKGVLIGDDAVFVVDVSGSAGWAFGGDPVGDLNNHAGPNTILDAEIAGFIALNQELIDRGLGNVSKVGVAAYSSGSTIVDMDPVTPGLQYYTTPLADADNNGVRDVDQALRSLIDGGATNFEAGLQSAITIVQQSGTALGAGNVVFLSDGVRNGGGAFIDEAAILRDTYGVNLRAFGVGSGSSLAELQQIDPAAEQFLSTNELLDVFSGAGLQQDVDYFRFTVSADGELNVRVDFQGAAGDVDLELLDSTGVLIAESKAATGDSDEVTFTAVTGQDYYVRVDGEENFYDLSIHPVGSRIVEGTTYANDYRQAITLLPATQSLSVRFSDLGFDTTDESFVPDAFELVLLDGDGQPAATGIASGHEAFFNITEGAGATLASGVAYNELTGEVTVDVSHLDSGAEVTLVARLVNTDGLPDDLDTASRVRILPGVTQLTTPVAVLAPVAPLVIDYGSYHPVDLAVLDDVTSSFDVRYKLSTLDSGSNTHYATFSLTNNGQLSVRDNLVIGIKSPTQPINLQNADGVTADGIQYLDLSGRAFGPSKRWSTAGDSVDQITLELFNPSSDRFDFELVVLGQLNAGPAFTNTPRFLDEAQRLVEAPVGVEFRFDAEATDPNGDALTYSVVRGIDFQDAATGPQTGVVSWTPAAGDVGSRVPVTLLVEDAHGGFDELSFTLVVTDSPINRAPVFDATPTVEAYVNTPYAWTASAYDPDGDSPLYYRLDPSMATLPGLSGADLAINESTGEITWTPTADQVDQTFRIQIEAWDRDTGGLKDDLDFDLRVFDEIGNHDPYFTSRPGTDADPLSGGHYVVADPDPNTLDPVTPDALSFVLEAGETTTTSVSISLPSQTNSADIVFVVDESGSMQGGHAWLGTIIEDIDQQLIAAGVTNNRFALTTFGTADSIPKTISAYSGADAGREFVSATAIKNFINGGGLNTNGADEDGFTGIAHALQDLSTPDAGEHVDDVLRADAAKTFVLITDEGREVDYYNPVGSPHTGPDADYLTLIDALAAADVSVDSVVWSYFRSGDGQDNRGDFQIGDFPSWATPGVVGEWAIDTSQDAYTATPTASGSIAVSTIAFDATVLGDGSWEADRGHFTLVADLAVDGDTIEIDPASDSPDLPPDAYIVFDYESETNFKWLGVTAGSKWLKHGTFDGTTWTTAVSTDLSAAGVGINKIEAGTSYELRAEFFNPWGRVINVHIDGQRVPHGMYGGSLNGLSVNERVGVGVRQRTGAETVTGRFDSFTILGHEDLLPSWGPYGYAIASHDFGAAGGSTALGVGADRLTGQPDVGYLPTTVDVGGQLTGSFERGVGGHNTDGWHRAFTELNQYAADGDLVAGPSFTGPIQPYVNLAWARGGASWDLNYLRSNTDPLYRDSFASAFVAGQVDDILDRLQPKVRSDDPAFVGATPVIPPGAPENYIANEWVITFEGDGDPHGPFDLEIVQTTDVGEAAVLGTIPVAINAPYVYELDVVDPDGDFSLAFAFKPGSETYGATLDANHRLVWDASSRYWIDVADPANPTPLDYTFDLVVTDGRGGVGEQSITVTVEPPPASNTAPVIDRANFPLVDENDPAGPRHVTSITAQEFRRFRLEIPATDAEDAPRFYLIDQPDASMTIDRNTGVVEWTPGAEHVGEQSFTVRVTDGKGGIDEQTFVLTVAQRDRLNLAPSLIGAPSPSLQLGETLSVNFNAADLNGDDVQFYLVSGPEGMAIHADSGQLRWKPTADQTGDHSFVVAIEDSEGARTVERFEVEVTLPLQRPVILTSPGDAPTAQLDRTFFYPIELTDIDSTNAPVFVSGFSTLPDASAGYFSDGPNGAGFYWTPTTANGHQVGDLVQVGLVFHDGDYWNGTNPIPELTVGQFFVVSIVDNANTAPTIDATPRTKVAIGQPFRYRVQTSDADGDPLTVTVTTPAWITETVSGSGVYEGAPTTDLLGQTFNLTVTVDDERGEANSVMTETYAIEVTGQVENSIPVINGSQVPSAVVDREFRFRLSADDLDNDTVYWRLIESPEDPSIAFDGETGLLVWTPTEEQLGEHRFSAVATDGIETTNEYEFTVTVRGANTPARLVDFAPPRQVVAGELFEYTLHAEDIDGGPNASTFAFIGGTKPSWLNIDSTTGRIYGTAPSVASATPFDNIGVYVTDAGAGAASDPTLVPDTRAFGLEVLPAGSTINAAPVVENSPAPRVFDGQNYAFTPIVSDPNGGTPTWSLAAESTAAGMQRVNDEIIWDTAAAALTPNQNYYLMIEVTDPVDATLVTRTRFVIFLDGTRASNSAPVIDTASLPDVDVVAGSRFTATVVAPDADGDRATLALVSSTSPGVAIDEHGRVTWDLPTDLIPGSTADITVVARDAFGGESTPHTFTVTAIADTEAPTVSIAASQQVAPIGTGVLFRTTAVDNVGVADRWLTISDGVGPDVTLPVTADGVAYYTFDSEGTYTVSVTAVDASPAGNTTTSTPISIDVFDPAGIAAPTAALTWTGGGILDAATTATFDVGYSGPAELLTWTVRLKSGETSEWTVLQTGVGPVTTGQVTLDPFALPDGPYVLQVLAEVTDPNAVGVGAQTWNSDQVAFSIGTGGFKVGQFGLSFVDLAVPVAGIPLAFSRTYDSSTVDTANDFGAGWTLDLFSKAKIGFGFSRTGSPSGQLSYHAPAQWTNGSEIHITLPGGETQSFKIAPTRQVGYVRYLNPLFGSFAYSGVHIDFEPLEGVASSLDFANGGHGSPNQFVDGWDVPHQGSGIFDFVPGQYQSRIPWSPIYELSGESKTLNLTSADGFTFEIEAATGNINAIESPDGSRVVIRDESITSYDAEGNLLGWSAVRRDGQGRVVRIESLDDAFATPQYNSDSELINGQQVSYTYDANGDLVSVTGVDGAVTTLEYNVNENAQGQDVEIGHEHFLTRITDPTGVRTLEAAFNAQKQLVGIVDASGESAAITHLTQTLPSGQTAQVDTVEDAFGNPTELARDSRGNVVRSLVRVDNGGDADPSNDVYQVTAFEYDSAGRLLGQSQSFQRTYDYRYASQVDIDGIVDPAVRAQQDAEPDTAVTTHWASRAEYDERGNLTRQQDALGNVTRLLNYTDFGQPTVVIDPSGNRTESVYDNQARLQSTRVLDINGAVLSETRYEYDERFGGVTRVLLIDETGAEVETGVTVYDDKGRPVRSTDAQGVTQYTVYDEDGQVTLSFSYWDEPDPVSGVGDGVFDKLLVSRSYYDESGRTVRNRSYALNASAFAVDTEGLSALVDPAQLDIHPFDSETTTAYDAAGRVLSSTDSRGRVSTPSYNLRNQTVESRTLVKDENGVEFYRVSRTVYDNNGRAVASSDPFLLNLNGTLATPLADLRLSYSVFDPAGRVVERKRIAGAEALISIAADPSNASFFTTSFNEAYAVAAVNEATGLLSSSKTEYDSQGRVFKTISSTGVETYPQYDHAGRQTGTITAADVDGDGVIETTDANGDGVPDGTLPGAPSPGNPAELIVTQSELDASGRQTKSIDPLGRISEFAYDSAGRVIQTLFNDFTSTRVEYDALGNRTAEINQLGERREFEYDDQGRQTAVLLPAITIDDPQNPGTNIEIRHRYEYGYDQYGNHTTITTNAYQKQDGTVVYLRKDASGVDQVVATRDPATTPFSALPLPPSAFTTTLLAHDHFGRQVSRRLPEGITERTYYNDRSLADLTVGVTDPAVQAQVLRHSVGLGQTEYLVDFEGNVTAYRYDNTPAGGGRMVATYYYDTEAKYLADKSFNPALPNANEKVTYKFDAYGREVEHSFYRQNGAIDTTRTTYDAEGRVVQSETPEGVLFYEYDALGRQTSVSTGSEVTPTTRTEYGYDVLGRLETVVGAWQNGVDIPDEVTTYRYDVAGQLDKIIRHGGVITDYAYDDLGRLDVMTDFIDADGDEALDAGEMVLASYDYDLRADGKRSGVTETDDQARTTRIDWAYDSLGRLSQEVYDSYDDNEDYTTDYLYDLASNRTNKLVDRGSDGVIDETTSLLYDANDRLISETFDSVNNAEDRFTLYNFDGTKQTGKTVYRGLDATGVIESDTEYEFNLQGRLGRVTAKEYGDTGILVAQQVTEFEYNQDGVRTLERNANTGDEREFLIDSQNKTGYAKPIEEWLNGSLARSYTIGNTVLSQANAGGASQLLLLDGHASTRMLFDLATMAILESYRYTADGDAIGFDPRAAGTSILYGGDSQFSAAVNLYNHLARWRAQNGWLSLDPFFGNLDDPLSLHKYLFVHGDEVNGWDPTGLFLLDAVSAYATGIEFAVEAEQQGYDPAAAFAYGIVADTAFTVGLGLVFFGVGDEIIDVGRRIGGLGADLIRSAVRRLGPTWEYASGRAFSTATHLRKLVRTSLRSDDYFENLAALATRNPNSSKLVLGKWQEDGKSYTRVAAHFRATYFKLDNWRRIAKSTTEEGLWKINEAFLGKQLKQGKQIALSHDPAKATGFYAREINFLKDAGYTFTKEGWVWKAVR